MTLDIALTALFVVSVLAFLASVFLFGEEKPCIVPLVGLPICLLALCWFAYSSTGYSAKDVVAGQSDLLEDRCLELAVDRSTRLSSVEYVPDGRRSAGGRYNGKYLLADEMGGTYTYSTKQEDFIVVCRPDGEQRVEELTVVYDGFFGLKETRHVTRLSVSQLPE